MPRHWLARTLSILWMFAGVVFVAFYTAQLTTTLTVEQIRGAIEGPDGFPGEQVGTVAHSNSRSAIFGNITQRFRSTRRSINCSKLFWRRKWMRW